MFVSAPPEMRVMAFDPSRRKPLAACFLGRVLEGNDRNPHCSTCAKAAPKMTQSAGTRASRYNQTKAQLDAKWKALVDGLRFWYVTVPFSSAGLPRSVLQTTTCTNTHGVRALSKRKHSQVRVRPRSTNEPGSCCVEADQGQKIDRGGKYI